MEEILIEILIAGGALYLLSQCTRWKLSWWSAWAMAFTAVMTVEFIDSTWQKIGIMCGVILILSYFESKQDEADERTSEQGWQNWRPSEPDRQSWRPVDPKSAVNWRGGIAGWTIGIAAVCMVGSKLTLWQQYREAEAKKATPPPQARMVQPTPQTPPPQVQTPMPEVVIPEPQPRQVDLPRTRPKPAPPPTPDQTILCWIDGNGKRTYSNTVPQGKGIQPCP